MGVSRPAGTAKRSRPARPEERGSPQGAAGRLLSRATRDLHLNAASESRAPHPPAGIPAAPQAPSGVFRALRLPQLRKRPDYPENASGTLHVLREAYECRAPRRPPCSCPTPSPLSHEGLPFQTPTSPPAPPRRHCLKREGKRAEVFAPERSQKGGARSRQPPPPMGAEGPFSSPPPPHPCSLERSHRQTAPLLRLEAGRSEETKAMPRSRAQAPHPPPLHLGSGAGVLSLCLSSALAVRRVPLGCVSRSHRQAGIRDAPGGERSTSLIGPYQLFWMLTMPWFYVGRRWA